MSGFPYVHLHTCIIYKGDTPYWPGVDQQQTYGSVTVTLLQERDSNVTGVTERTLSVHVTAKVSSQTHHTCGSMDS